MVSLPTKQNYKSVSTLEWFPEGREGKQEKSEGSKERIHFMFGVTILYTSVQNVEYFVCTKNPIKYFSCQNQLLLLR